MARYTLQMPSRVAHASRLGQEEKVSDYNGQYLSPEPIVTINKDQDKRYQPEKGLQAQTHRQRYVGI